MTARTGAGGILLAWLTLTAPATAQVAEAVDRSALRVCADPAAAPLSAQDGSGLENRIAALFAQDLGVPVRYTWFPNTIGFYRRTLNARRCDLVMGAAAGMEMAATTRPYYRSGYALVTRRADGITAATLADPALNGLRIGVQARTPPADILARTGKADAIRAYDLMVDSRITSIGAKLTQDLAARTIDAAVLWGPIAAHFGDPARVTVTPLPAAEAGVPLAFDIAMAVRNGEPAWRARVDRFLTERQPQIARILADYRVPIAAAAETPR